MKSIWRLGMLWPKIDQLFEIESFLIHQNVSPCTQSVAGGAKSRVIYPRLQPNDTNWKRIGREGSLQPPPPRPPHRQQVLEKSPQNLTVHNLRGGFVAAAATTGQGADWDWHTDNRRVALDLCNKETIKPTATARHPSRDSSKNALIYPPPTPLPPTTK